MMADSSVSQTIHYRRLPEVLHQTGIWRRPSALPGSIESLRRFSFAQQDIEKSKAIKIIFDEDMILEGEGLPQRSREFVPPSPPISVWSCAMSCSNQSEQLSEVFVLSAAKNLRYHRDSSTVTPSSVRESIDTTDADYGFSVAISDSDSSLSKDEEIYSELLSISTDIPREILVRKSLSQRFPFLRRLAPKLFRQSTRKLEL